MDDNLKKYPAKGMRELDVKPLKANPDSFLARRKMLGASSKDIASALIKSSPIGRGARVVKGALKATGLMGAGYAANEAEDMIREKIEKKKMGGMVFEPRGQKPIQVKKQISRIR